MTQRRLVLGISGASGAAVGVRIAEILAEIPNIETHLIVSEAAEQTLRHEVGLDALARLESLVALRHKICDIGASIASGSLRTVGMIIAPCSMRTVSAIAAGLAGNLLTRAADVHLKERRRLVLLVRESPFHLGHLRAMTLVTEYGAVVAPLVPAFYLRPVDIAEIIDHLARRAITAVGIETRDIETAEWSGVDATPTAKSS